MAYPTLVLGRLKVNGEEGWYAFPTNSSIRYKFIGDTLEDQQEGVQVLAKAMQGGLDFLEQSIGDILELGNTLLPEDAVQLLYGTTSVLNFDMAPIFIAPLEGDADVLIECLEAAGEMLAMAL